VFSCFKKFKILFEKKGYYIKSLRMNRSEFYYNDFNEFYEDHGKNKLLIVARSP